MKNLVLIFVCILGMLTFSLQATAQDGLPKGYEQLFSGIPHMGGGQYERVKAEAGQNVPNIAFVVCDNKYHIFLKDACNRYELSYTPGDLTISIEMLTDRIKGVVCFNISEGRTDKLDDALCSVFGLQCKQ